MNKILIVFLTLLLAFTANAADIKNSFINNLPNYDGELEITINNISQSFNKLLWRTDQEYNINAIVFETFFGGSQPKYSTPNDTWSYFKNIQLYQ